MSETTEVRRGGQDRRQGRAARAGAGDDASAEDIAAAVTAALAADDGVFGLADSRGRQVLVPSDKLAYVEIGESETRKVGFGTL